MSQDQNRRRRRQQRRERRAADDGEREIQRAEPRAAIGSRLANVRETIDSFGGFLTIGAIGAALLVVGLLFYQSLKTDISDDALLGDAVQLPAGRLERAHTSNPAEMIGTAGEPPSGGPHFSQPWPTGVFDEAIPDGNAVHSLEHGIVWISYNPELVDAGQIAVLEDVADDFRGDVILAPRPQNARSVYAVSWGRVLGMDGVDGERLREFVRTNRDRSPEPGVR
ncbi:MAG: DUF3105 domain-containing protein [Dehalococcoidia bacterium]